MSALVPPPQLASFDAHYTESEPRASTHVFVLKDDSGRSHLKLKLNVPNRDGSLPSQGYDAPPPYDSDAPSAPAPNARAQARAKTLPYYVGNASPITGTVELDLKKRAGISSVVVTVRTCNGNLFLVL